jgi:uncharacterized membrane protein YgcG
MQKTILVCAIFAVCAAARAEIPRAPDGTFSDRAKLIADDDARLVRIRQDFFTRATGCPLYVATLPSTEGHPLGERAGEVFHRWHALDRRLPDDAILLIAFGAERETRLVLGPSVPRDYETALSPMPPVTWAEGSPAGPQLDKLVFDLDARLAAPAAALGRRRGFFVPPVPRSFVLDGEGRFPESEREKLDRDLESLSRSTGYPVVAVLDPPGLPYATGDFSAPDTRRWIAAALVDWTRDRPELSRGAVLFAFTSKFLASIALGAEVAGRVPAAVREDLEKDFGNAQTSGFFDRAILRIASTLDRGFAGKRTMSVRSPLYAMLHPWVMFAGADEPVPLAFKIFLTAVFLYLLGWFLYLWITHPRMMLMAFAGSIVSEVIGGAVSSVAGESAGKFFGGGGSFGGGGASGTW